MRLFKLQYGDAAKFATVLTAVFAESATAGGGGAARGSAASSAEGMRTQVTRLRALDQAGKPQTSELPKTHPALTIQADTTSNVIVVAARSDLMPLIADIVQSMDIPGASFNDVRIVPLANADATRLAKVLTDLYSGARVQSLRPEQRPTVTVDTRTNALVIAATRPTFEVMHALILKLDGDVPIGLQDIRLLTLSNADAATMAAALQKIMDARVQRQESLGVKDAEQPQGAHRGRPAQQQPHRRRLARELRHRQELGHRSSTTPVRPCPGRCRSSCSRTPTPAR